MFLMIFQVLVQAECKLFCILVRQKFTIDFSIKHSKSKQVSLATYIFACYSIPTRLYVVENKLRSIANNIA